MACFPAAVAGAWLANNAALCCFFATGNVYRVLIGLCPPVAPGSTVLSDAEGQAVYSIPVRKPTAFLSLFSARISCQ